MIMISVLFSNEHYLKKYNKTIPKTWDQLIETTEYILFEEKKLGNNDINGYVPLFPSKYIHILLYTYE